MSADKLPPLPEPSGWIANPERPLKGYFTADQMRAYAAAAVQAEQEACAKVCEDAAEPGMALIALVTAECAAAIRARGARNA